MIRRKLYPDKARLLDKLTEHLKAKYSNLGFQTQIIKTDEDDEVGAIFQTRKLYSSELAEAASRLTGLDIATTVKLQVTGNNLEVEVGGGKWLDKALVAGFAAFVAFSLLIIPAGIGAVQQHQLIMEITDEIEIFLNNPDNWKPSGEEVKAET
jgi:hypothetical protein